MQVTTKLVEISPTRTDLNCSRNFHSIFSPQSIPYGMNGPLPFAVVPISPQPSHGIFTSLGPRHQSLLQYVRTSMHVLSKSALLPFRPSIQFQYPTSQNGSFGSPGLRSESFYGAGSDDFRVYVWHIPEGLASSRREFSYSEQTAEPYESSVGMFLPITRPKKNPLMRCRQALPSQSRDHVLCL